MVSLYLLQEWFSLYGHLLIALPTNSKLVPRLDLFVNVGMFVVFNSSISLFLFFQISLSHNSITYLVFVGSLDTNMIIYGLQLQFAPICHLSDNMNMSNMPLLEAKLKMNTRVYAQHHFSLLQGTEFSSPL